MASTTRSIQTMSLVFPLNVIKRHRNELSMIWLHKTEVPWNMMLYIIRSGWPLCWVWCTFGILMSTHDECWDHIKRSLCSRSYCNFIYIHMHFLCLPSLNYEYECPLQRSVICTTSCFRVNRRKVRLGLWCLTPL